MAFDEVQLDPTISQVASGGASYKTVVVATDSGAEQRVSLWSVGRLRWTLRQSMLSPAQVIALGQFFRARGGRARGFRFQDWSDYTVQNEALVNPYPGTGMQLVKTYTSGGITETRTILKPQIGQVQIYQNGTLLSGSQFSVNTVTGIISLTAPVSGAAYTWTGQFDTPVRFDVDTIEVDMQPALYGMAASIPVVELIYPGIAGVS